MSEQPGISTGISKEDLKDILAAAIGAAKAMNPLEEKAYKEKLAQEERKAKMVVALGRVEEEAALRKRNGCSHSRHASGKLAGHACPKGQGEWVTSGQMHSNGKATMVCERCSTTWHWEPTVAERDYIENAGMLGMAPPEESRLIKDDELATV